MKIKLINDKVIAEVQSIHVMPENKQVEIIFRNDKTSVIALNYIVEITGDNDNFEV